MRRLTFWLFVLTVAVRPCAGQDLKPVINHIELAAGDSLVFLGDSITHQCLYTQYVEDYYYTRYPGVRIRFHNAGVGGDKAIDALLRFNEDVAQFQPKYVTILLGMNDGRYTHFDHEIFKTYEQDMTALLDRIEAIGAAAIPIHPTMFDSRAVALNARKKPDPVRDTYYNSVLAFYGMWLQEQALNRGLGFVNMYSRLNQLTMQQRATDPNFTMIVDAVHPGPAGQVVMAFSILEDMNCSRKVSSINAVRRGQKWVVNASGGKVSVVEETDRGLSFTFQADSLPWVVPEDASLGYQLVHAGHKMSNERIAVIGLSPGKYELRIDDQLVGTYTHIQFGSRVELQANSKTPQYQQAMQVALLNKERNDNAMHSLRNEWRALKGQRSSLQRWLDAHPDDTTGAKEKKDAFAAWQSPFHERVDKLLESVRQYDDKIYAANQPKPRKYEVLAVE